MSSYWTGIGKAPVFAMIIALVGCFHGFQVTGSAESVGEQTTISVVQSIFLVIVADAAVLDRLPLARPLMSARRTSPRRRCGHRGPRRQHALRRRRRAREREPRGAPGEIFALVGGSGSGKSTLLREIILLQPPVVGLDPRVRPGGRRPRRRRGAAAAPALGRDVRARRAVQLAHRGRERRHGAARAHPTSATG